LAKTQGGVDREDFGHRFLKERSVRIRKRKTWKKTPKTGVIASLTLYAYFLTTLTEQSCKLQKTNRGQPLTWCVPTDMEGIVVIHDPKGMEN